MPISQNKTVRAKKVTFQEDRLYVLLSDEREISVPLSWFPRLQEASSKDRGKWRLIGQGSGIHWEAIDEDISVAGLLGWPED
jgi:hypothetical protein